MTILIVEDEMFLLHMMQIELQEAGYTVITAKNGEEAIALLKQTKPDFILLDLLMPKVDGFGVLQFMRAAGMNHPVIVLSNLDADQEREKCVAMGALEFIVKSSLDSGELADRVARHLKPAAA